MNNMNSLKSNTNGTKTDAKHTDEFPTQSKSWYYYPWVWFILALLFSAVIGSFATLKIGLDRPNDLMPLAVNKFALETAKEKSANSSLESAQQQTE